MYQIIYFLFLTLAHSSLHNGHPHRLQGTLVWETVQQPKHVIDELSSGAFGQTIKGSSRKISSPAVISRLAAKYRPRTGSDFNSTGYSVPTMVTV